MPNFPIIDAHVHFWDAESLDYPWLASAGGLARRFDPLDFKAACGEVAVEAMVFVEAGASDGLAELAWVQALAEPRIGAIVAGARIEEGGELERLAGQDKVRGLRRIYQDEPDLDFARRTDFIKGVQSAGRLGLSFDLCIKHPHLAATIDLVDACPNVEFVLDHIGKPAIASAKIQPWADQLRDLARRENVVCKISGVATEARAGWAAAELRPYMDLALAAFGPKRLMFGGDWPVSTLAIGYGEWLGLVEAMLSQVEQEDVFRETARRFYRLA